MINSDLSLCDYDILDNENENKEDCFLDKEYYSGNSDEGIVDLEIELVESLKEIQRLRKTIKRQATELTQVNTQEELKKEKEEIALLTRNLQNKDEKCQAQEHEIVSLKVELKEAIQLNSDMKQEKKNLKEQFQEKKNVVKRRNLKLCL